MGVGKQNVGRLKRDGSYYLHGLLLVGKEKIIGSPKHLRGRLQEKMSRNLQDLGMHQRWAYIPGKEISQTVVDYLNQFWADSI